MTPKKDKYIQVHFQGQCLNVIIDKHKNIKQVFYDGIELNITPDIEQKINLYLMGYN